MADDLSRGPLRAVEPGWPGPVLPFDGPYADADAGAGAEGSMSPLLPRSRQRATLNDDAAQQNLAEVGHAVVPFLDAARVRELLAVFERLGPSPDDPRSGLHIGNHGSAFDWKRAVDSAVRPLVAESLAAVFDRHVPYYVTFMVKWPGEGGGIPAHQDPTMIAAEESYRGVTLWAPLVPLSDERGRDRGTLRVVDRSHRWPGSDHYRARWYAPSIVEEMHERIDRELSRPLVAAVGEAIVFDHRLVHFSRANLSDGPRIILGIGLRPEETFNVNLECDADGWVSCYIVDDEYYIRDPDEGTIAMPPLWRRRRVDVARIGSDDLDRLGTGPTASREIATSPATRAPDRVGSHGLLRRVRRELPGRRWIRR